MRKARRSIIGLCAGLLPVFLMAQACWAESLINTIQRPIAAAPVSKSGRWLKAINFQVFAQPSLGTMKNCPAIGL